MPRLPSPKQIAFSLTTFTVAAAALAGCGGGGSSKPGTIKPTTDKQMFDTLGVDTTATPRTYTDRQGNPHTLSDGYNPLGQGVRTLSPLRELYVAGRGIGGTNANQMLLDDFMHAPVTIAAAPSPTPVMDGAPSWTQNDWVTAVPADLDGDGIDEIVNFYWIAASKELHANVVRCMQNCTGNGGTYANVKDSLLAITDANAAPADRDWFKHSFAAADVDGDDKQDLVVVNFGGIHACTAAADFKITCAMKIPNASTHMSVARGRFDDVPDKANDDVVVAWGNAAGSLAYVSIYDGSPNSFSSNSFTRADHDPTPLSVLFADQPVVYTYGAAYVTTGDIDFDGRDEIVLAGHRIENGGDYGHWDLFLMDDRQTSFRFYTAFRYFMGAGPGRPDDGDNQRAKSVLKVFTKRTKPVLERAIYAGSDIIDGLSTIPHSDVMTLASGDKITAGTTATRMSYYEDGGGSYNHSPSEVVIGDVDGDGHDSVIAVWDQVNETIANRDGFLPTTLARCGWDAGKGQWTRWTNFMQTTTGNTQTTCEDGDCDNPIALALPNVDHDSAAVRYRKQHEVLFSSPRVLAVLSAPPFYTGVNEGNSQTSVSFGTGTGFGTEGTIGVSTGFSIGYEAPSLFGLTTLSWKLSFNAAMDWISSNQVSLEETQTWTTGTDDAVVFSVIPFDVYYYEVVSSPDASDVGKTLSINVPRKLNTYKVPVDLYNASILDGPQIDGAILTHKVGDPKSYPMYNACSAAAPGGSFGSTSYLVSGDGWCYASANTLHVGVGSGSVGFTIARTDTSSAGVSTDLSVNFEMEQGAGGFTVGQSVGFHWGYSYTVDTSRSYSFDGQVGDLPNATHGYDFGLMAHRGNLAGRTDYPAFLVDYWVQNVE